MKSKQVLSIEQMKHLQELGLDTSDASMVLIATDDDSCTLDWQDAEKAIKYHWHDVYFYLYDAETGSYDHSYRDSCGVFTLQDILDKLPCFIGTHVLTLQKLANSGTCLYMEPYSRSILNLTESKELIDAAYEMLCWCIENGYIKTNQYESKNKSNRRNN